MVTGKVTLKINGRVFFEKSGEIIEKNYKDTIINGYYSKQNPGGYLVIEDDLESPALFLPLTSSSRGFYDVSSEKWVFKGAKTKLTDEQIEQNRKNVVVLKRLGDVPDYTPKVSKEVEEDEIWKTPIVRSGMVESGKLSAVIGKDLFKDIKRNIMKHEDDLVKKEKEKTKPTGVVVNKKKKEEPKPSADTVEGIVTGEIQPEDWYKRFGV